MAIEIIAEAGVNHNGSIDNAKRLIEVAVESEADYIKFQSFKTEKILRLDAPKADYQLANTGNIESQFEMIKKLELDEEAHYILKEHAEKYGITFLSTPFDTSSVDLLHSMGMEVYKIPSGEITNIPQIRKIGAYNKRVFLSTGMSFLGEIEAAVLTLTESGTDKENITVLHCNTDYPTSCEDVNLLAMVNIGKALGVNIGYSDHTLGIEVPIAAAALGAKVIEKHFTLDRSMDGPDHKASLEPDELKQMVRSVRNIEKALGDGVKRPTKSEANIRTIARKSIVAEGKIEEGERFTDKNLTVKRPGSGISPCYWDLILGMVAHRTYDRDELIGW